MGDNNGFSNQCFPNVNSHVLWEGSVTGEISSRACETPSVKNHSYDSFWTERRSSSGRGRFVFPPYCLGRFVSDMDGQSRLIKSVKIPRHCGEYRHQTNPRSLVTATSKILEHSI